MRDSDRCEFSEFSFGYALVDNAVNGRSWGKITGAPRLLSLSEEGAANGGFDVELPFRALPLFLQFKIPQVMRRRSKLMPQKLSPPYYRMHLRTRRSNWSGKTQHEQMVELEGKYPLCVYYVTPRFSRSEDLDRHYLAREVPDASEWFSPSVLGALSRDDHHVAYHPNLADYEVHSEPRELREGRYEYRHIIERVTERLNQTAPVDPTEWVSRTANNLLDDLGADEATNELASLSSAFRPLQLVAESNAAKNRRRQMPRSKRGKVREFRTRLRELGHFLNSRLDTRLFVAYQQG